MSDLGSKLKQTNTAKRDQNKQKDEKQEPPRQSRPARWHGRAPSVSVDFFAACLVFYLIDGDHLAHTSTTLIELKEDQKKLKEVKEIALIFRKVVEIHPVLAPSSSTPQPSFVTLLQQEIMSHFVNGPHLNQA